MNQTEDQDTANRHKQERKDLQSKIQSLKKSITKGDKKKKKEVQEEITKLEQQLDQRQSTEAPTEPPAPLSEAETSTEQIEEQDEDTDSLPRRVTRAGKRRSKKALEEKEREKRIAEQDERNKEGPRVTEMASIKAALKKLGLQLHNIPADGNCLYCAVNHQLEITEQETFTVNRLRKLTAEFMREGKDDFLPFMYNESDDTVSEEYFESYCKEVATTKLWGGQLELRALSNILKCPIKVIQASGPPTLQGENFEGPQLILTYHRHLYRLGEHYNSTVAVPQDHGEEPPQ